ncbi:MAG: hypothetical protein GXY25_22970 [Pirellulaceae bacterium]|jgi:MFS family permease|nr:hypothetical protein [Thermoguttaceae bacterium]MDI9443404.1 hypothetical protein [Planctomycetota bacterium]NLZ03384.1 hypothetical protein [Pirellulaceae bacterium]
MLEAVPICVAGQEGIPDMGVWVSWAAAILPTVAAVCLVLWALVNPRIGRVFAKIFAVLAVGGGIGVLAWGICAAVFGEPIRSLAAFPTLVTTSSEVIGFGAGLLICGVTALILSLVGGKSRPGKDRPL